MSLRVTLQLMIVAQAWAFVEPLVTAAAQLAPRATDPSLVGYISGAGGYSDARSCDYPQTVSTSGSYVQCCPSTGGCEFFTSCSANTLFAAGATVPCDVNAALTCNTAIVVATAGAATGDQYLACWQKTLGSSPFTIVQNIQGASVVAATTGSASGSSAASSASSRSSSASASSSRATSSSSASARSSSSSAASASAQASSTTSSQNIGAGINAGVGGGIAGAIAMLAQMLL